MGTLTAGTVKDLYRQLLLARSQRPWRRISPTLSSFQRRNLRFPTLARTEGIDRPTLVTNVLTVATRFWLLTGLALRSLCRLRVRRSAAFAGQWHILELAFSRRQDS